MYRAPRIAGRPAGAVESRGRIDSQGDPASAKRQAATEQRAALHPSLGPGTGGGGHRLCLRHRTGSRVMKTKGIDRYGLFETVDRSTVAAVKRKFRRREWRVP